jgi:hypothetical protein
MGYFLEILSISIRTSCKVTTYCRPTFFQQLITHVSDDKTNYTERPSLVGEVIA